MASQAEKIARERWGAEKSAAFDLLLARFWNRAAELATADDSAELVITPRIHRGAFVEGRFDGDEKFA